MRENNNLNKNNNDNNEISKLVIDDLIKIYKMRKIEVVALRGLSCVLDYGKINVIMGPSGCGKTTFLNILGGIDRSTSGKVYFSHLKEDITQLNQKDLDQYRRERIGYIFQDFNLIPTMNVEENIALTMHINKFSSDEIKTKVSELLKLVHLENRKNHFPDELSGGEKQRVAIASALAHNPEILLCDEPTGELDSESKHMIMDLFLEIIQKYPNKLILIVTHDNSFKNIADMLYIIKDGKISYHLSKDQILTQKQDEEQNTGYIPLNMTQIQNGKLEELEELAYFIQERMKRVKQEKKGKKA